MKLFLTARIPDATRVLLVESGSRAVLELALARMAAIFPQASFDLCTCFPGLPASQAVQQVWRVTEAPGLLSKLGLAFRIARTRPPIAALVFSGEPIMFNWKLILLLLLPSKILVVNEHGDFFWLDAANLTVLRQFLGVRWGVSGEELVRGFSRLVCFPFVFVFLLVGTGWTYLKRWVRLLAWRFGSSP